MRHCDENYKVKINSEVQKGRYLPRNSDNKWQLLHVEDLCCRDTLFAVYAAGSMAPSAISTSNRSG